MATIDPDVVAEVKGHTKRACRHIFGDGFADEALDLWEGTPHATSLFLAAKELLDAAGRIYEVEPKTSRHDLGRWDLGDDVINWSKG